MSSPPQVVLASASEVRQQILQSAGVDFTVHAADLNETPIKKSVREAGGSAADAAMALAEAKALTVSPNYTDAYVVGADQILELEGRWFDKPVDRQDARNHLLAFRGKTHHLVNGLAVALNGEIVWRHGESVAMGLRLISDEYLDTYLNLAGDEILASVGAYRLEGPGAQLFETIEGDYFAVLGLPLLPLLSFFRQVGIVAA